MKVLIIDADWRFLKQARSYLESHAHLVVHQNQPAEAILQALRWHPDLVILSAELAQGAMVDSLYALSPRPAILLTDHMDRFDRAWRGWQNCGDELLLKPVFQAEDIQSAVVAALENAAAGTVVRKALAASA